MLKIVRNRLYRVYWNILYFGILNSKKEIKTCHWCGKDYLIHDDSINYRNWNISGYYEHYSFCSTGRNSCYSLFIQECVDIPESTNHIDIYVVS